MNIDEAISVKRSCEKAECPSCCGQSLPKDVMLRQLAETGDTSGACGVCDNEQEVLVLRSAS